MHSVTRCLVLLVAVCAISSSATAPAGASPLAPGVTCGSPAGRTLAHSARGRVYVLGQTVYGCVAAAGAFCASVREGPCPRSAQLGPFALAGGVAAYALRTCGVDTASAVVIVRRLADGRVLSTQPATEGVTGPESFQAVGSIVVRADGAVAWIGSSQSIATHRSVTEVLERSAGRLRRLGQGSAIRPRSLTLRGAVLSWRDGARRRTALLR